MRRQTAHWITALLGLGVVALSYLALLLIDPAGLGHWLQLDPRNGPILQLYFGLNIASLLAGWHFLPQLSDRPGLRIYVIRILLYLLFYGLAVLNLFLIGLLFTEYRADRLWLLILLLPAAGVFASAFRKSAENLEEVADAPVDENEPPLEEQVIPPARTPGTVLRDYAWSIFAQMLALTVFFTGLYAGGFAYGLLKAALFNDRVIALETVPVIIDGIDWTPVLIAILPILIVLPLVIGLVGLAHALFVRLQIRNITHYERQLSQAEEEFLESSADALIDYAEAQKYPKWMHVAPFAGVLVLMITGMFAAFAATYFLTKTIRETIALQGLGGLWYSSDIIGFGTILSIFAGIIAAGPLIHAITRLSPRFAECAYLRHGWNTMNGQPRSPDQLFLDLDKDLRLDRISAAAAFDPRAYIQRAVYNYEALWIKLTAGIVAMTLLFALADGLSYHAYAPEGIYQSRYLSLDREFYDYREAVELQTTCYIGTDDGDPVLRIDYRLEFANGARFRFDDLLTPANLQHVAEIDALIVAAGVPHIEGAQRGIGRGDRPGLDPACLNRLQSRFGDQTQEARRLLRI